MSSEKQSAVFCVLGRKVLFAHLGELCKVVIYLNFLQSPSVCCEALVKWDGVTFGVLYETKNKDQRTSRKDEQLSTKANLPVGNGGRDLPVNLFFCTNGSRRTMHDRDRRRSRTAGHLRRKESEQNQMVSRSKRRYN